MKNKGLYVSQKDIRRYELLEKVLDESLTLAVAAAALGVSYRQALRLKARVKAYGLAGLLHRNRGRAPHNRCHETQRDRVLELSKERYFDFNDSHFTEMLGEREKIQVSRETVRRWRRGAGIAPKRKHKPPKHRKRRPRKEAEGLMMLWDGSPHRWFGTDYPACCLMAAIDDATCTVLGAFFCPAETSWAYLKLLEQVVVNWGVPARVYQDRHGTLKRNDDHWSLAEELEGRQRPTQVGAALEALGITPIFALSPQAKGRIERLFNTLQDRPRQRVPARLPSGSQRALRPTASPARASLGQSPQTFGARAHPLAVLSGQSQLRQRGAIGRDGAGHTTRPEQEKLCQAARGSAPTAGRPLASLLPRARHRPSSRHPDRRTHPHPTQTQRHPRGLRRRLGIPRLQTINPADGSAGRPQLRPASLQHPPRRPRRHYRCNENRLSVTFSLCKKGDLIAVQ